MALPRSEPDGKAVRALPVRAAHGAQRFDAFVSYAHRADAELAPAVRLGLERLAKPWYRRRAMSVYLDAAGLEVTPTLWTTISSALAEARYLVLLCSPEAAGSDYVGKEIRFWLERHGAGTILPVLTSGTWTWDEERSTVDPEHSSAAHPALCEAFTEAPRYLDLTWTRTETDLDLRNGRFRDAIAQLASPISGRPKSEIEGEDVRQHRRTVRTAWTAATALAILLVAALVGAFVAVSNGNEATRERDVATSRLLATQSTSREGEDPQLGGLLALAAAAVSPTDEARGALMRMNEHDRQVLGYLPGGVGVVEASAFSPDGQTLATGGPDDPVRLWDVTRRVVVAEQAMRVVSDLTFTPDGKTLVVATADGLTWWDVPTRTQRAQLTGQFTSVGTSRDGRQVIGGTIDGGVVVADATSAAPAARLAGLGGPVTAVALSADGRSAAAGQRAGTGTAVVWDVATGAELTRTGEYSPSKGAIAFSPDGQALVASGAQGRFLLLRLSDRAWTSVPGHDATVYDLVFTDADTIVSGSADGDVGRWSTPTPDRWDARVRGPLARTTGSVVAPDGRTVLSGAFDGTAVLWRLDEDWSTPWGSLSTGWSMAVDPSGRWTAGVDGSSTVVEITDHGATTRRITVPERTLATAVDRTGHVAIGRFDGAVAVHDGVTGQLLRVIGPDPARVPVVEMAWSPDGRLLATAGLRGDVVVHDVVAGTEYARIPAPPGGTGAGSGLVGLFSHVTFSPDGRTLAHSSLAGGLRLWDVASRSAGPPLRGPSTIGAQSVAFSPSGNRFAQGGLDGTVVLWDPARPSVPVASYTPSGRSITGLAFLTDETLAAGSRDGAGVTVLDLARGTPQATLRNGTENGISRPSVLPDGALVVTDATGMHRYDLTTRGMRDRLCGIVGRDLTPEEWSAYIVGRDQEPLCAP